MGSSPSKYATGWCAPPVTPVGLEDLLRPASGPPRRLRSEPGRRRMVRDRRADPRVDPRAPGVPRGCRTPVVLVPLRARDQVFERGCGPGELEFQLGDPHSGSGRSDRIRTSSTTDCPRGQRPVGGNHPILVPVRQTAKQARRSTRPRNPNSHEGTRATRTQILSSRY
jgi:hypothetical protein